MQYQPMWQTWTLVRRTNPARRDEKNAAREPTTDAATTARTDGAERERVQMARIERCMSIYELAQRVECDPETLSAFERGDEILSGEVQRAIRAVLRLA